MITFSEIESVTLEILKLWTNVPTFQHLRRIPLKSRISLLAELVFLRKYAEEN